MDQLLLALRVAVSLAVVIGMIWALSKVTRRWSPTRSAAIQVVSKVSLSKRSSLIVVGVGDRGMLLGVTDHGITQLGEVPLPNKNVPIEPQRTSVVVDLYDPARGRAPRLDSPQFEDFLNADVRAEAEAYVDGYVLPAENRKSSKKTSPSDPQTAKKDALAGSVLSPNTWRQAVTAIRDKTVRS